MADTVEKKNINLAECEAYACGVLGLVPSLAASMIDLNPNGPTQSQFRCWHCKSNPYLQAINDLGLLRAANSVSKIHKYSQKKTRLLQKIKRLASNFVMGYIDCGHGYCNVCIRKLKDSSSWLCSVEGCEINISVVVLPSVMMDSSTAALYVQAVEQRCMTSDSECPRRKNCMWQEMCPYWHANVIKRKQVDKNACQETLIKSGTFFKLYLWEFVECKGSQPEVLRHEPSTVDGSALRVFETYYVENDFLWQHILSFYFDFLHQPLQFASHQCLCQENLSGTLVSLAWHMETLNITPPLLSEVHAAACRGQASFSNSCQIFGLPKTHLAWLGGLKLVRLCE